MSLQTRLEALATALGADVKAVNANMGSLASLTTTAKTSLVAAINEVKAGSGGGGSYPWNEQVLTTTYVNATLTGSDVFTGFVPVANTRYIVDVLASVQANAATTGVQTALAGPTTGVTRAAVKVIAASTSAADTITHTSLNNFQTMTAGLITPTLLSLQAIVEVGATPGAGNIRFQARSEVAIANAVQIFPGSSMRWRTI